MTDDQMVAQRLRAALERIQAPELQLESVLDRARRRRARSTAAAVTLAGLVLVGLGVPLILLGPLRAAGPGSHPAAGPSTRATPRQVLPPARSGWTWHIDGADGTAVQAPRAWTYTTAVTGPADPAPVFALATGPIPAGGDCAPTAAIQALPKNGMLLWVLEYRNPENPYEFPPRSSSLELGPLAGPFECIGERTHLILFRQAGRFFQAHVMFGPAAPRSLRADAVAALSEFTPEPRDASTQQHCRQGTWIYCPEAAWVFQVINKAGLLHWGSTATAIQAGRMGDSRNAKLNFWATKAGSSGPQRRYTPAAVVGGVTVYRYRTRLLWQAQDLDVWIEPAAGSSAPVPSGKPLERLVTASLQIPFLNE
jgi:hypothetical protein